MNNNQPSTKPSNVVRVHMVLVASPILFALVLVATSLAPAPNLADGSRAITERQKPANPTSAIPAGSIFYEFDLTTGEKGEVVEQPLLVLPINNRYARRIETTAKVEFTTAIKELEQQVATAETEYLGLAEKLTQSRRVKAKRLQPEVTKGLQGLGMNGAKFEVSLQGSPSWSQTGIDDVEFRISTIPGSQPGSLAKIASGGELSRISLAIQVITARTSRTPTLIFDEVDVGVGGATAEVVGSLLRKLGGHAQIICVTHLPQVAAQGHQHYVVAKSTTKKSASTTVVQLNEEEKIDEIARMLGGVETTELSLAHAEAMLSGVEPPIQEKSITLRSGLLASYCRHSGHNPYIFRLWSVSSNPSLSATFFWSCSISSSANSSTRPHLTQTIWS